MNRLSAVVYSVDAKKKRGNSTKSMKKSSQKVKEKLTEKEDGEMRTERKEDMEGDVLDR